MSGPEFIQPHVTISVQFQAKNFFKYQCYELRAQHWKRVNIGINETHHDRMRYCLRFEVDI